MAETGKRRKKAVESKAKAGTSGKTGKLRPVTLRLPESWLALADSLASGSVLGATQTSVLRAAVQKGLAALAGRPVG